MAIPTDSQATEQVLAEFDTEEASFLESRIDAIYAMYADRTGIGGGVRLRILYTQRHCINVLLRSHYRDIDIALGSDRFGRSVRPKTLLAMKLALDGEIKEFLSEARAEGGAVCAIRKKAPEVPVRGRANPNSPRYRGDPLRGEYETELPGE
jgi:hypothetical protein